MVTEEEREGGEKGGGDLEIFGPGKLLPPCMARF